MDRISTASAYSAVLANLMKAEVAETNAGNQLSSNEASENLQGYGAESETLIAMQTTNTQVTGYLNNTEVLNAQLSTQNSALTEVADSATSAIHALTAAIGSGNGTTLMQALGNAFSDAVAGLNSTFNGQYLFSGGQSNTQPVTANTLSDLTSAPSIASLFNNGQLQTTAQVDQNTSINTGFLASDVGTTLFQAFQTIEAYTQSNGPFGGQLTTAQTNFLSQQITSLDSIQTNLNNIVGQNGEAQNEVTSAQTALTQQQTMLQNLIGDITEANVAQATTNLQQAQLSVEAAGQVFQALNSSSLLNSLSVAAPVS